jgi:hypothetical protein
MLSRLTLRIRRPVAGRKDEPWKTLADVELAGAEYVGWFNAPGSSHRGKESKTINTPVRVGCLRAGLGVGLVVQVISSVSMPSVPAAEE